MEIIDFELARYDQWKDDLEKRRRYFESTTGLCLLPAMNTDASDKKMKIMDDIWNADGPLDLQIKKRCIDGSMNVPKDEIDRLKDDLEKNRKKFKNLTKKQEQLLKGINNTI